MTHTSKGERLTLWLSCDRTYVHGIVILNSAKCQINSIFALRFIFALESAQLNLIRDFTVHSNKHFLNLFEKDKLQILKELRPFFDV